MTVPGFQEFMLPALRSLNDGGLKHWREIRDDIVEQLKIDASDQETVLENGRTVVDDRALWTMTHLFQAGLVARPSRGVYVLTAEGAKVVHDDHDRIDQRFLTRYPSYVVFRAGAGKDSQKGRDASLSASATEDEQPVEEQFLGEGTGVELEDTDGGRIHNPWDPESIRVATKTFSLKNVLDMIDDGDLELAPDFQRNKVWKSRQKSRLIESLLLQIPLPAFYFAEDTDGMLRVVDGLQRLSTIHDFVNDPTFKLRDLEYLSTSETDAFDDLSQPLRRRLFNTQIVAHVIDPVTPAGVKYDIFKRINTGGDPLNSMEIRHCMSKPRSRAFLRTLAHNESFDRATDYALKDHVRMNDREAVLRFVAFSILPSVEDYDEYGSLESLLNWANDQLDDPRKIDDKRLESITAEFSRAMKNAYLVFGAHAFRKWPVGQERLMPINRALFESWGVALAHLDAKEISRSGPQIREAAREAMSSDVAYIESISSSTSDPRRVSKRFGVARRIVEDALK